MEVRSLLDNDIANTVSGEIIRTKRAGESVDKEVSNDVKVQQRENADGTKELVSLNLNDANIVHSPYYNLQQNDILYVEPNKAKARGADISSMTSMWFSATSLLMAVVTFLLNLTNIK